jgi:hypothetical protein
MRRVSLLREDELADAGAKCFLKIKCGSPLAPRKASVLERKPTTSKNIKGYENSIIKKGVPYHQNTDVRTFPFL